MASRRKPLNVDKYIGVALAVLGFIGGFFVKVFTITDSIATKTYVDEKISEKLKDPIDKIQSLRSETKSALDDLKVYLEQYSNSNRKGLQLELSPVITDMKSDVKAIAVKQDLMFEMMKAREGKK
jgi:type I site-specific restriction-modification system R (restriction) subunit